MACALGLSGVNGSARVLDDFEGGSIAGWHDFVLGSGWVEVLDDLVLHVPATAGAPLFVASQKVTETFAIPDGPPLELRVAVVRRSSLDAFAVLAWVPVAQSLASFRGYFIAQSGTELRVGKGIHKYFSKAKPDPPLKHENVTLVLALSRSGDRVTIRAQVLDKDADDAVLFDQTFTDTPDADALAAGTDWPAAPWIDEGRFTLMGYTELEAGGEQERSVAFDNVQVSAPAPANLLPWFHDINLANGASFLVELRAVNFRASDDQSFQPDGIAAALDGPFLGRTYGRVSDDWKTVRSSNIGGGQGKANREYAVRLFALDAQGASNNLVLRIDTFCPKCPVVEVENYNFSGGRFIEEPLLLAEEAAPTETAYRGLIGQPEIDYHVEGPVSGNSPYRPADPVSTRRSLDYTRTQFVEAGGAGAKVFDYDVHAVQAGDWLTYTRTFSETSYRVYLRQALVNIPRGEAVLEKLDGPAGPGANWTPLGRFVGEHTGFEYRNMPLITDSGQPVTVELGGVVMLRLRQLTSAPSDGAIYQNYLVFVPAVTECTSLEYAREVTGPWFGDWTASLDWEGRTATAKRPADPVRFYRTTFERRLKITTVNVVDDKLVLKFEQSFE